MKLSFRRLTVLILTLSAALGTVVLPSSPAGGGATNRAGVVVRQSDGTVRDMCVFFDVAEITGHELLERSGIEFQDSRGEFFARAICKIGPDGCDTSQGGKCFCDSSKSWNYYIRNKGDSTWGHSSLGPDERKVKNGSLDGWSWGTNGGAPQPPSVAFSDVCRASATSTSAPQQVLPSGGTSGGTNTNRPPSGDGSNTTGGSDNRTGTTETERLEIENGTSPEPSEEASPSATDRERNEAQGSTDGDDTEPASYLMFGGFALVFALIAAALYFMRRRKAQSDT